MVAANGFVSGCGIYKIENTTTGKVYVGSAISLYLRQCNHIARLRKGGHHSPKLQNSWNKHGAEAFVFSVLEYVDCKHDLAIREQHWMDTLDAVAGGYNVFPNARTGVGRTMSAEARAKLSVSAKNRPPVSDETRAKLSAMRRGRPQNPVGVEKRAAAQRGKKRPPPSAEARLKMSVTHKNRLAKTPRERNASGQFIPEGTS